MSLKDELAAYAAKTHADAWQRRKGTRVPDRDSVTFGTDAVEIQGTVLYADLADSTRLVTDHEDWFAAEVYKNYLYVAAKVIRARGGVITAYDGDRVMAVFIGDGKSTAAVKAGMQIQWAVGNIMQPALRAQYPTRTYAIKQKVGVDTSTLLVAKTGIRASDDLVWVGTAANNAAKMAALNLSQRTLITPAVYTELSPAAQKTNGNVMWSNLGSGALGIDIYGTTYTWAFD